MAQTFGNFCACAQNSRGDTNRRQISRIESVCRLCFRGVPTFFERSLWLPKKSTNKRAPA